MGMRNFGKILYKKMFDALPRDMQWRTKRDLQHESDVHRLYMLTSFRQEVCQEGVVDEEAAAAAIAARAEELTFQDQLAAVQDALQQQAEDMCLAIRSALVEAGDPLRMESTAYGESDDGCEEATKPMEQQARSSLGFAVSAVASSRARSGLPIPSGGQRGNRNAPELPVVPLPRGDNSRMSMAELSAAVQRRVGYTLRIASSSVDHPDAGYGLWLEGHAPPGSIVAFYPGVVYNTEQYRHIPGYPHIDRNNSYLISRYDGVVLDAKPWAAGDPWGGNPWPPVGLSGGPHSLDIDGRNPWALGHFANHPAAGVPPNVMVASVNFSSSLSDSGEGIRRYLPNVTLTELQRDAEAQTEKSEGDSMGGGQRSITGLCLVTTAHIEDEEVFLNYRYSPHVPRPSWYVPVDAEEDKRRWAT